MKCENCGNEHDGSYGSGRFCSKKCRGIFSAKKLLNPGISRKWICNGVILNFLLVRKCIIMFMKYMVHLISIAGIAD
jgi:hypothetical protein